MLIKENTTLKSVSSKYYNYTFDKQTGYFARWGVTKEQDPVYAPAPEILDLEISSGGDCLGKCPFCYKSNGFGDTHNMTFEEFKTIFDKLPRLLTQIAFGIMNISTNPDFFDMMAYSKAKGVVPNYTCHGFDVTPEFAKFTAKTCGAVAVSAYDFGNTLDAISLFQEAGCKQVNVHYMLARETYDRAFEFIDKINSSGIKPNAIVFLQLKKKGRAEKGTYHYINSIEDYKQLMRYAENKVGIGFDSCSAPIFMKSAEDRADFPQLVMMAEPCESSLFSAYINCHGQFFPCSFAEGMNEWSEGLDVLNCQDFIQDIWLHDKTVQFRNRLVASSANCVCRHKSYCRHCPIYDGVAPCES